jgi:hypothetical protein
MSIWDNEGKDFSVEFGRETVVLTARRKSSKPLVFQHL